MIYVICNKDLKISKLCCFIFLFFNLFSLVINCKKVILKNHNGNNDCFKIASLDSILKNNTNIRVRQCFDKFSFEVAAFPLSEKFPHKGYFKSLDVLFIPLGKVISRSGIIITDNFIIKDLIRVKEDVKDIPKKSFIKTIKCPGRLAVIAQVGMYNYFHWVNEVLGRLALLEMHDIKYDKLLVPISSKIMQESLIDLWGIDKSKIIFLDNPNILIEADELIVPSIVINKIEADNIYLGDSIYPLYSGHYIYPYLSKYVKEKLLFKLKQGINFDAYNFSKKVFISRSDACSPRKILNENEIFELFEKKGFKSYVLSKMSLLEQIVLFYNAEMVVGEHGAGLANILFCKPKTKVIELFQSLVAIDYWWMSRVFDLDYTAIKTIPSDADYFANMQDLHNWEKAWFNKGHVSLDEIKQYLIDMQ